MNGRQDRRGGQSVCALQDTYTFSSMCHPCSDGAAASSISSAILGLRHVVQGRWIELTNLVVCARDPRQPQPRHSAATALSLRRRLCFASD